MIEQNSILQVWKFRKKYFFLTALPLIIVITVIVRYLPPVYESKSTILIEQQQIPPDLVRSTVTGYAEEHIQLLTQQILSRPKLLEIINKFNLYSELRKTATTDGIIDQMREDIQFKTISAEHTRKSRQSPDITIAFRVSFQGKNPQTVQNVAATLASLYLEQNLKFREGKAQTTTKFLEAELQQLREQLHDIGKKITVYKESHEGILPEMQQFNFSQVERLEAEIKQLNNSIRAAENQRIYLQGLLETVDSRSSSLTTTGERTPSPRERLRAIDNRLADLRSKFSEDHPDIQTALREKVQVEKLSKQQGLGNSQRRQKLLRIETELARKQGTYSDQHPEIQRLKKEIALLKSDDGKVDPALTDIDLANPAQVNLITQIQSSNNEIKVMKAQQQNLVDKLTEYRHRLEEGPKVEQAYLALQRDYKNAQAKYQEVMNKLLEARIGEGMEEHQKGEKLTIIDPATYPEKPVKPNRPLILILGVIFSSIAGFGVMAGVEKRDHSIKSAEDLAFLTRVPPLGIIARIQTPYDLNESKRRKKFLLVAGCISFFLGILMIHLFYTDLWVLAARFLRRADITL